MQKGGQDLILGWQRKELHQLLFQHPQLVQDLPGPSIPALSQMSSFLKLSGMTPGLKSRPILIPSPTHTHETLFILLLLRVLQAQS